MEPNQNIQSNPFVGTPTTANNNMMQNEPSVNKAPEKKNNGLLIGLILCLLFAIGGIGFGVWTMVDSNSQIDGLNRQIKTLQEQNNDLLDQVEQLSEKLENINMNGRPWADVEVLDGAFYVKDAEGNVIVRSNEGIDVEEIISCDSSADKTVLTCKVNTAQGEGEFLYDIYGDSLGSSFEEE